MNKDNIRKVRDVIASQPAAKFDMARLFTTQDLRDWWILRPDAVLNECGTAACIAGWTLVVFQPEQLSTKGAVDAEPYLGLNEGQAFKLFTPPGWKTERYTRAHAVRVLDHLLETGEVNWIDTRRPKKGSK